MEVAKDVMKRSIEICSLMFGKMFNAFDHSLKKHHAANATNDKDRLKMTFIHLLGIYKPCQHIQKVRGTSTQHAQKSKDKISSAKKKS